MSAYQTDTGMDQGASQRMKDDIQQKSGQIMDQAREKSDEVIDQARETTRAMLDQQKGRAADGLGSVASALRQTGQNLQGEQGTLGNYAQQAADKIENIAGQLRDKDVDQILNEAEDFARREPEIFLGGAVLLGLLAARFMKSSTARRQQMRSSVQGAPGQGQWQARGAAPRYPESGYPMGQGNAGARSTGYMPSGYTGYGAGMDAGGGTRRESGTMDTGHMLPDDTVGGEL